MNKPCGVIVSPRPSDSNPEAAALRHEVSTLESDQAMIQELRQSYRDQIGELFGGKHYLSNHLFWEIEMAGGHVEVTRYYPDRAVAVDIYESIGKDEQKEINFKRTALKRLGVRYAAIDWNSHPSDILPQIGLP